MKEYKNNEELLNHLISKCLTIQNKKFALEIEQVIKSLVANTISEKYGIKDYLKHSCFDQSVDKDYIDKIILGINEVIDKNYGKHTAINHYKDIYGFIPPFVLVKVMTMG